MIELINNIIAIAVKHGGDYGGPYNLCEEELVEVLKKLLIEQEINGCEIKIIYLNNMNFSCPQIIQKQGE